jgi:hypothetical protein
MVSFVSRARKHVRDTAADDRSNDAKHKWSRRSSCARASPISK